MHPYSGNQNKKFSLCCVSVFSFHAHIVTVCFFVVCKHPWGGGGAVGWLAASSLHSWQNGYGNHASSSAVIFLQVQRTGIFGGMGEINYFHLTGSVSQDYRPLFLS